MEIHLPYEEHQINRTDNKVELEGAFGRIVICCERGITSAITSICMTVYRPVTVHMQFRAPVVCLRYWLKGDWDGRQGSYQLVYQPAGEWIMDVGPGEYHLTSAAAGEDVLNRISPGYSCIREVLAHLAAHQANIHRQYASRIDAKVKALLHQISQCDLPDINRELFMEARMTDLILQYLNYISSHQMNFHTKYHFAPADVENVYRVKDMYDQMMDEPPSFKVMATSANMHPRKLSEGFQLLFGKKMKRLLIQSRLEKAAELLQNPAKTIREVAVETGFNHFSVFSRAFKRHFGRSPLAFRK